MFDSVIKDIGTRCSFPHGMMFTIASQVITLLSWIFSIATYKSCKFFIVKFMRLAGITISQENLKVLFAQATAKRIEVTEIRCEGAWKVFRSCLLKNYNFIFASPVNIRTIKPSPLLSLRVLELSEINFGRNISKYFVFQVIQALNYIPSFEYLYLDTFYAEGTCFPHLIDRHSQVSAPNFGDKKNFQCQIQSERGELTNIFPIKNIINFSICIRIFCPILDYSALASYLFRPPYKSKLYILFGQIYRVGSVLNYLRQLNLLNTLRDSSFMQI